MQNEYVNTGILIRRWTRLGGEGGGKSVFCLHSDPPLGTISRNLHVVVIRTKVVSDEVVTVVILFW